MEKVIYEKYGRGHITEKMLEEAAVLFNNNYGIWGERAGGKPGGKPGTRVRLTADRLRAQCLPDDALCSYSRVIVDGELAGNAFACRWKVNGKSVLWMTQLVVDINYRERGLAMGLLSQFKQDDVDIYGLMSSHPASCMAGAKAFGSSIETIRLDVIEKYAQNIMEASPIKYVKDAKLRGSIFNPHDTSGAVSSVDSEFFVDHTEPLEALAWVQENMKWPLGELLDGHEFLLIIEARRRSRSRSTSRPKSGSERT